jgi:cation transport ATPase
MTFDLSRLRRGEKVAAGAAIVLFIVMFFGWYGPHDGPDLSFSAWESYSIIDLVLLLTIVAALGLAFLTATQQTVALPVTAAVIVTALAFLGTLLVAFRVLIDQPGFGVAGFSAPDAAVDNTIWAWVGLIAVAAITYGGYLSMRDEGTSLSDVKAQASAAGQQARASFDSSTPRSEAPPAASQPPAAPPPPTAPAPAESPVGDEPTSSPPPSSAP